MAWRLLVASCVVRPRRLVVRSSGTRLCLAIEPGFATGAPPEKLPVLSGAGRSAAMFEREAELALIERGLGLARDGRGAILLVEGTAGIGKTRLITAADKL